MGPLLAVILAAGSATRPIPTPRPLAVPAVLPPRPTGSMTPVGGVLLDVQSGWRVSGSSVVSPDGKARLTVLPAESWGVDFRSWFENRWSGVKNGKVGTEEPIVEGTYNVLNNNPSPVPRRAFIAPGALETLTVSGTFPGESGQEKGMTFYALKVSPQSARPLLFQADDAAAWAGWRQSANLMLTDLRP